MITISGATLSGGYSLQYETAGSEPTATRGSISFNGSSQYLDIDSTTAFGFGTADFTIEFFWRPTVNQRSDVLDFWSAGGSGITSRFDIGRITGTTLDLYTDSPVGGGGSGAKITGPTIASLILNTWTHVAVTKESGSIKLWVNGTQAGSTYSAFALNMGSSMALRIMGDHNAAGNGSGNLSNIRVVRGTALYTARFTPPIQPLTAVSGTNLLLNTANGANFLTDSSNNNLTITNNGSVPSSNTHPFTPGSGKFGTSQTLQIPINSAFTYGTGDFTVEWWSYQNAGNGVQGIWRNSTGDATNAIGFWTVTQPSQRLTVTLGNGTSSDTILSNTTVPLNTWHHYAIVRSGTTFKLYLDGVAQTQTITSNIDIPAQVGIMQIGNAGGNYIGLVTNFRIVKGTAVYTSDFTVPTEPLTAIANTSLLLSFYPAGIGRDSSPFNHTITLNGATSNVATPFIFSS
jgi:hypothetical protein